MRSGVIFGAGNIGRGFIGQLFSESGYEVVFVDVDEPLIQHLNARGAYSIHIVNNEETEVVEVSPLRAYHAKDLQVVSYALSQAKIAATAVGARVLPIIAPLVAEGVMLRAENKCYEPLNIIICENLKDAAAAFRSMVLQHLPADFQPYFHKYIGFVDTVIGRMVPPPTPQMRQEDPSLILVEPYNELPVDKAAFKGEIPTIVGMQACDDFPVYTARKLYVHNCGHAFLAYLGYLKGYEYGFEALEDGQIRYMLEMALSESIQGIVAAYPVEAHWLEQHKIDLIHRFANRALGDTIFRLGRDPIRKLAPKDRLVAAAQLVMNGGVKPTFLALGIASGYCFDPQEDDIAVELQQTIQELGIVGALEKYSALTKEQPLTKLVLEQYQRIKLGELFKGG